MSKLAVKGGKPVITLAEYKRAVWPPVDEECAEQLKELYLSGQWSFNSAAEQKFEKEFAEYHGAKYGIFMANGTVTLECALTALGIKQGDEVIVPGLTWLATAMAVVYVGGTPVFADIEKDTCCLSPEAFEKAITPKTKAVIPVHLYGSMANLDEIIAIARKHGIAVIEDCAHMQGGKWNGRGVGSWGDVGSFSFQQSKTLSSGEGGICLTNDEKLADLIYRAKHIGYSRMDSQGGASSPPPAEMICHNYRSLAFCATILSSQLKKLPERLERYNRFADNLRRATAGLPGFSIQAPGKKATCQGYYSLELIFEPEVWGADNVTIGSALQAEGMAISNKNYGPVYKHMLFNTGRYRNTGCPVADFIGKQAFSIPHQSMDCPEMAEIFGKALAKVYENKGEL